MELGYMDYSVDSAVDPIRTVTERADNGAGFVEPPEFDCESVLFFILGNALIPFRCMTRIMPYMLSILLWRTYPGGSQKNSRRLCRRDALAD